MSFIGEEKKGVVYAPGYFLAHEECVRETRMVTSEMSGDGLVVKAGTIYPNDDNTAVGFVYEDVDVSTGDMPGSVVTKGVVYENRLAEAIGSDAKAALTAKGFTFITEPTVTRP